MDELGLGVACVAGAGGLSFYLGMVATQLVGFGLNSPASTRRGNVVAVIGLCLTSAGSVGLTHMATGRGRPLWVPHKDAQTAANLAAATAGGVVAFALLGGRLRSLLPSHYCKIGGFARPRPAMRAMGEKYADSAERGKIALLGSMDGCHTCGSRKPLTKYVADHQPPNLFAKQLNSVWYRRLVGRKVPQYFYAQCEPCSLVQSRQVVRHAKPQPVYQHVMHRSHLKLHLDQVRAFHLAGVLANLWWVWSWSLIS